MKPAVKKYSVLALWWGSFLALGAVMIAASAFIYLSPKLPPAETYREIRLENPLRIFSIDNKLIAEFGSKKRDPIKYEDIPPQVIDALIASEDTRFYRHNGVDLRALARSVVGVLTGNRSGGASTLTMQVAKNISFEGEDPYSRKFKEILLALQIERELTKENILELYLNRAFFGISAYGIKAASLQFYNKAPEQLTLAEVAMLIAILPAPNAYNPLRAPDTALNLRSRVLNRMYNLEMINETLYEEALSAPITAQRYGRDAEISAPYIAEMVRQEMIDRYGDLALTDGFEVYTSIDSRMQQAAQQTLVSGLETYDRRHGYRGRENHMRPAEDGDFSIWLDILSRTPTIANQQPAFVESVQERSLQVLKRDGELVSIDWDGISWAKRFINTNAWGSSPRTAGEVVEAGDLIRIRQNDDGSWSLGQVPEVNGGMVAIDPNDGAIRALVGGYDFYSGQAGKFNRVTQAHRQPGSNFKPFLYATALENNYTPATLINDAPLARSDYRPQNFNGRFSGPTRLKYALTTSNNLVSLRLYDQLGSNIVLDYIRRFGFDSSEFPRNDLTVAIGSHALTPMEIATGYTVFANGGYKVEPYLIDRIINFNDGEVFRADKLTVCEQCTNQAAIDEQLANNEVPETAPVTPAPRVIDEDVAYIMNTFLRSVITDGSGRPANRAINRQDIAGKTGTTDDVNDLWFSGFNGNLVATVYVGFDQVQSLGKSEQAATVALPIWIDFMKTVLAGTPESFMSQPDGLVTVRIDPDTGLRSRPGDPDTIFEVFREENVPGFANEQANPETMDGPPEEAPSLEDIF